MTYYIWEDGEGCDERLSFTTPEEAQAAAKKLAEDWADGQGVEAAWEVLSYFEVITQAELDSRKAKLEEEEEPVRHQPGMACSLGMVHPGVCSMEPVVSKCPSWTEHGEHTWSEGGRQFKCNGTAIKQ